MDSLKMKKQIKARFVRCFPNEPDSFIDFLTDFTQESGLSTWALKLEFVYVDEFAKWVLSTVGIFLWGDEKNLPVYQPYRDVDDPGALARTIAFRTKWKAIIPTYRKIILRKQKEVNKITLLERFCELWDDAIFYITRWPFYCVRDFVDGVVRKLGKKTH